MIYQIPDINIVVVLLRLGVNGKMSDQLIQESLSVRDQVANIIRKRIMRGILSEGDKISERMLSEELNISTTPVKEAMRMLNTEGLLFTVPRKGTYVSDFAIQNILHVTFIRSVLEGVATFFAVDNLLESEIDQLENALIKSKQAILDKDFEALTNSNQLFHNIIRTASKNIYLLRILESFRSIDYSIRVTSLRIDGESEIAQAEHMEIFNAIRNRNNTHAENLMVAHIRRVAKYALNQKAIE